MKKHVWVDQIEENTNKKINAIESDFYLSMYQQV